MPISRGLHVEWLARDDLRKTLDLNTIAGRQGLIAWWCRARGNDVELRKLIPASSICEVDNELEQDALLPISRGLHAEWWSRDDLRKTLDLNTLAGRQGLIVWWCRERTRNLELRELISSTSLCEIDNELEQDALLPLTRGLHAEWLARDDLRQTMDLNTIAGRQGLIAWWGRARVKDSELRKLIPLESLCEPDNDLEQDAPLPLTRGLHVEWLTRDDLRNSLDLNTRLGRQSLIIWWFLQRKIDKSLDELMSLNFSPEVASIPILDGIRPISRAEHLFWLSRKDLRGAFDISQKEGRTSYLKWLRSNTDQKSDTRCDQQIPMLKKPKSFNIIGFAKGGVNIIGYGRGEFGIGEDVRMAVRALSGLDLDICVPHNQLHIAARQKDICVLGYESSQPIYRTNLICLPHYETLRLLGSTGYNTLDRRYNIAYWQWEFARFPEALHCALDLVDEIWSSSTFIAEAMQLASAKPVIVMPMAVHLPTQLVKWTRADFDLPEGAFIFLTVLDGNSSLKRKNPLATVRAFAAAFPDKRNVRLVVKAMNVNSSQEDWRRVIDQAGEDDRIIFITETMTKDKLLGLQSVCDSFVSLHRSEGFGRNIAEAMLLGKPVVVSDYSGNQDFTKENNAFLVSGKTIPLARRDYLFGENQVWFDPDITAAANMLKSCFENEEERKSKALAGQIFVREHYSAEIVGANYAKRLIASNGT